MIASCRSDPRRRTLRPAARTAGPLPDFEPTSWCEHMRCTGYIFGQCKAQATEQNGDGARDDQSCGQLRYRTSPLSAVNLSPRCTIITPCFNDGAFLDELRRSLTGGEPVPHVIVDDGSTDPVTLDILASMEAHPDVTLLRTAHGGPAAARYLALRAVETRYVMPVDAHDVVMPGAIRDLADVLDREPELSVVWGDNIIFGSLLAHLPRAADLDAWWLTFLNEVGVGLMGRTDVLLSADWDDRSGCGDWGTALSLVEAGARGRNIGRVTYGYRSDARPRRLEDAEERDEENVRNLSRRYSSAFAQRKDARRRSSAPLSVRVIGTTVAAIPGLSRSSQHRWVNRLSACVWRRRWIHHPGDLPRHPLSRRFRRPHTASAVGPMALGLHEVIPNASHIVILSPHRDDAILSAFALLDDPTVTAEVVNVFTEPTDSADWLERVGAASAEQEAEVRQIEDQRALEGRASIVELQCGPQTSESELNATIVRLLDRSRHTHADGLVIAAPAGAGHKGSVPFSARVGPMARMFGTATSVRHNDHLLVRNAVVRWATINSDVTTIFYDELPYHWAKSALRDADRDGLFHLAVDTTTKAAAVRCYASQTNSLFTTEQLARLERWLPTVESYGTTSFGDYDRTE